MREYLKGFFDSFEYPQEAEEALLTAYDAVCRNQETGEKMRQLLERYRQDADCDFHDLLNGAEQIADMAGIHEYTAKFLLCACMSRALRAHYRRAGLSEKMWRTVMYDLKYKLIECRMVYGIWGSFVCAWFDRFFNMTRFGFERLQFELIPFGKSYDKNGVTLSPESTVINVHIPRTGGRLDADEVSRSYREAAAFFGERYGLKQIVFVCHSWLLYPKNLEVLGEGSNLRAFISDYDIIEWKTYRDYGEVWRLFDMNYDGDADRLPQNTSLRRAYTDWIRRGERIGWGYGVYVYGA